MLKTQVGRVLFGAVLIALGLALRLVDENNANIVKYICGPTQSGVVCELAQFSFITIGLGAVWTLLILIGAFYAILYDWMMSTVTALVSDVVAKAVDIKSVALQQINANRLHKNELKELFSQCMANTLGNFEQAGAEFAEFVFDGVSSRRCPTWRRGHNTRVVIEEIEPTNTLSKKYHRYMETTNFTIVCPATGAIYPFTTEAALEATEVELKTIIDNFRYSLVCGSEHLDFDSVRGSLNLSEVMSKTGWRAGAFHLQFSEPVLRVTVKHEVALVSREINLTTDENSVILKSDKEYAKVLNEPSRGFTFRFRVPVSHEIVSCSASVDGFEWHPGQARGKALSLQERSVNIDVPGWALPGIATFVVWREK